MRAPSLLSAACAALALAAMAGRPPVEGEYDFRRRLEVVHEPALRDAAAQSAADEFVLEDGAVVALPAGASDFLRRAALDFVDFLLTSMSVSARVAVGAAKAPAVTVAVDAALPSRTYAVRVAASGIALSGADERALAQALYHLEDLMRLRRAPYLRFGASRRRPIFDVRMAHSGYGNDIFPDAHLNAMAHAGMTAILVFLDEVDKTKAQDYQDIRALIRRAARYGLDTYLYSYITAFAHPLEGPRPFEESYGRIAGHYPEAKGIILVGESCQFPSRDPRVQPRRYQDKDPADKRPLAGWFPCRDYPDWLRAVQGAIRAKAPGMELVFWTYNWGWAPLADRMKLIEAVPQDVTMMATFEMFERTTKRNGLECPTADYTLSFVGPGKYFVSEAEAVAKRGMRLYTQANAGGLTWDYGMVPYEPCPFQWRRRWAALARAHADWGLAGVMENHHFGWWPGFVSELEKEAFTEGGLPFDEHLKAIAARDYGPENADAAVKAWKAWSEAIADYVPTDANQYGPFRIGPAYPFTFGRAKADPKTFPMKRYASNGIGICRFDYLLAGYVPQLTPERMDAAYMRQELELLGPMAEKFAEGAKAFGAMAGDKAARMANFGEYLAACTRTAYNVKRGAIAFLEKDEKGILAAARDEYANAKAALENVSRDSRLGWEPSMEYGGGPEQIRWKLDLMERQYGLR